MLGLRNFTNEAEATAVEWRECLLTEDPWEQAGNPGEMKGESLGYFVNSGEVRGFAKPSKVDPEKFRAGHEKIASDLAFELQLPVPPVVLWQRPDTPDEVEQCVSISLVPFHPINKWGLVKRVPKTAERIGRMLSAPASAMIAFDTWIANSDVTNEGNLLVGEETLTEPQSTESDEPTSGTEDETTNAAGSGDMESGASPPAGPGSIIRAAYIDYAYSMSNQWTGRDSYQAISPAPIYPDEAVIDRDVLEATINAIESVPDETIERTVSRIPDNFLASDRRQITIDGLLHRKENLRTALAALLNKEQQEGEQP